MISTVLSTQLQHYEMQLHLQFISKTKTTSFNMYKNICFIPQVLGFFFGSFAIETAAICPKSKGLFVSSSFEKVFCPHLVYINILNLEFRPHIQSQVLRIFYSWTILKFLDRFDYICIQRASNIAHERCHLFIQCIVCVSHHPKQPFNWCSFGG